jgi:hypothetical protein
MVHIDLERLVCAGAIDTQFRELLLRDPLLAANGYYGDPFRLTAEEKSLIASIHTNDFQVFVVAVAEWVGQQRSRQMAPHIVLPSLTAALE